MTAEIKKKKAACNRAWAELEKALRRQNKVVALRKRIHEAQRKDRSADLKTLLAQLLAQESIEKINEDVIRLSKHFDSLHEDLSKAQQAVL